MKVAKAIDPYLKAFFNFIRNNLDDQLPNPCDTPMLKKLFGRGN